jgi:hypothetical protein
MSDDSYRIYLQYLQAGAERQRLAATRNERANSAG